jgi:hypothetical protein
MLWGISETGMCKTVHRKSLPEAACGKPLEILEVRHGNKADQKAESAQETLRKVHLLT